MGYVASDLLRAGILSTDLDGFKVPVKKTCTHVVVWNSRPDPLQQLPFLKYLTTLHFSCV